MNLVTWWAVERFKERQAPERAHEARLIYAGKVPHDGASFILNTVELLKRGHK